MTHLVALPAFVDNYIWMLHDGQDAVVVDPGDAGPVRDALYAQGLRLRGILVTHHHRDHTGGIDALRPLLHGPVFGPAREAIPSPFTPLCDGERIEVLGLRFEVIEVPGHTAGHIAYAQCGDGSEPVRLVGLADISGMSEAGEGAAPLLFCGDTLFCAGCGRLFEGTPAQMHASLQRLASLPADTRVCCTHEYTLSNLRFAAAVEPGNAAIVAHQARCDALRAQGRPTLPSNIGLERRINPFLRCGEPAVAAAAAARDPTTRTDDPVAVLAALRAWKNQF